MNIIPEDWERESQKDLVYLLEAQKLLEQEIMQEKKPANIELLDPEKILKKDEHESNILPF